MWTVIAAAHASDPATTEVPHTALEVRERVEPRYPEAARALVPPPETRCVARVSMDEQGTPFLVEVEGCEEPFVTATRDALLQWRWFPPTDEGRPVRATTTIPVNYRWEGGAPADPLFPGVYGDAFLGVGLDHHADEDVRSAAGAGVSMRFSMVTTERGATGPLFATELNQRGPLGRCDFAGGYATSGGKLGVGASAGLGFLWRALRLGELELAAAQLHLPVTIQALAAVGDDVRADVRGTITWPLLRSGGLRAEPGTLPTTDGFQLAGGVTWLAFGPSGLAVEAAYAEELGLPTWRLMLGIGT